MTEFTPIASLVGGVVIGLASAMLLALTGRLCGVSGIAGGVFRAPDRGWRIAFVLGMVAGGALAPIFAAAPFGAGPRSSLPVLAAAGLLVGIGTQLGGGCTSGHGLCGMSRLSTRSIAATVVFFVVAALTVFVARHVIGGAA